MIFVFKTSVKTRRDIKKLAPYIDEALPQAVWNFDLSDCDNILRVQSEKIIAPVIATVLKTHDFWCEELE